MFVFRTHEPETAESDAQGSSSDEPPLTACEHHRYGVCGATVNDSADVTAVAVAARCSGALAGTVT